MRSKVAVGLLAVSTAAAALSGATVPAEAKNGRNVAIGVAAGLVTLGVIAGAANAGSRRSCYTVGGGCHWREGKCFYNRYGDYVCRQGYQVCEPRRTVCD